MSRSNVSSGIVLLIALSGIHLWAQQNPPTAPSPATIQLAITVTDALGRPVPGLQKQDFALNDNKQPQSLLSFHAVSSEMAESPVEVLLVLDEVNTSFENVARVRQQLKDFLTRDAGKLARPANIAFFKDNGTEIGGPPTRDGNALLAVMNGEPHILRTTRRAEGFFGDLDRLQKSLHALEVLLQYESQRPGRKFLVWISPGWPSPSGPSIQQTPKNQEDLLHSIANISTELRDLDITVYAVDPLGMADAGHGRVWEYKNYLKPVRKRSQVSLGNEALQVLAVQSGGLVLNSSNDLAGELTQCVADAGAFYQLTFVAQPANGPTDFHQIEVTLDKPGLTARTRNGYYAQP